MVIESFREQGYQPSRVLAENPSAVQELNLAIVIPALNEAKSIGRVLDEISEVLGDDSYVVVVDGRSTDGTARIAKQKSAQVIYQNGEGYGDALRTGFLYVRKNMNAKVIVMMDADLTYDPKDIPKLIKPIIDDEADFVVGDRFADMQKGAMTRTNRFGNHLLSWFSGVTLKLKVNDTQCGIRAFRAELVDAMDLSSEGMPFATEMLAEAKFLGARISEVPVAYRRRLGDAKLSPIRDGLRILGVMIRLTRDTQPLLFFGVAGAFLGVIGLALGIDITLEWMRTHTVGRLPTVMLAVLLLIGSMQLLTLGLVADMIIRLRKRQIKRS